MEHSTAIVKTVINKDINYDPKNFVGYKTETLLDRVLSTVGGWHKATNYLVYGDPGVGKSTVILDSICHVANIDPTLNMTYVSGEMTVDNFYYYLQRYPKFGDIPMIFISHHMKAFYPKALGVYGMFAKLLEEGLDICIIDTWQMLKRSIQAEDGVSENAAELKLISLIKYHNEGKNKAGKKTAFIIIQQVTKGGVFVGSNMLAHLIDVTIELRYDELYNDLERYIYLLKNRVGPVGDKLYYSLETKEDVAFNKRRFLKDQEQKKLLNNELEKLDASGKDFEELFGIKQIGEDVEIIEETIIETTTAISTNVELHTNGR